jgi:A/G-specific adenine glycosylase
MTQSDPCAEFQRDAFRASLMKWYAVNQRRLPWRAHRDPYAVWISEVLLQQTRVDQAESYFHRFLTTFPSVVALSEATQSEVLKVCEGMGYYARARNLHEAAKVVRDRFSGAVPDRLEDLLSLPGVGPYTARAVLSIAFGRRHAVLDGNVKRILSRVFNLDGEIGSTSHEKTLWSLAESLVCPNDPGGYNQALMDLGSMVCRPRKPKCPDCPIEASCLARKAGREQSLPRRKAKPERPHLDVSAGIIMGEDRVLITKRFPKGLLGGLWEFPGGKKESFDSSMEACLAREIDEELAIEIRVGPLFMKVRHAYTHFRITLYAFLCRYVGGEPQTLGCADFKWVKVSDIRDYAFPKADRKILEKLESVNPFELMP